MSLRRGRLCARWRRAQADDSDGREQVFEPDASLAGRRAVTIVLMSTSGFSMEAHELAERRLDRTVILPEPNHAGGWTITGPAETKAAVRSVVPTPRGRIRSGCGFAR